jgi:hypothetical protein
MRDAALCDILQYREVGIGVEETCDRCLECECECVMCCISGKSHHARWRDSDAASHFLPIFPF